MKKRTLRDPDRLPPVLEAIVAFLVGGLFGAVSLLLATQAKQSWDWQRESQRYAQTRGTITALSYEPDSPRCKESGLYWPNIVYEYEVEGTAYTGTRYAFDNTCAVHPDPFEHVYGIGRRVDVYYDPARPGTAVLRPYEIGGLGWIVRGVLLAAFGGVSLLLWGWLLWEHVVMRLVRGIGIRREEDADR